MPPKAALTSSFSVSDATNEVVCPLTNQDGSHCRKRCLGEKRYRSMQEHIRRAHPDYYIPKLPATEESFQLMITTPPSQRPPPPPPPPPDPLHGRPSNASDTDLYAADISAPDTPFGGGPADASAAVALAQLHHNQLAPTWDADFDIYTESDVKGDSVHSGVELPSIREHLQHDTLPAFKMTRPRELLPSILDHSPPGRYASLPPIQRKEKLQRPRKPSMGENARKGKHERTKSKEFSRRLSIEGRKAMSAEPPTAAWVQGKRWEDLIEAATSATEVDDDLDRDLTPVPLSPAFPPSAGASGSSSHAAKRSSLPPGFRPPGHLQYGQYNASPLQHALTPPPPDPVGPNDPEPFPSVESMESAGSGQNFHIPAAGLPGSASTHADSSPLLHHHHHRPSQHSASSSFGSRGDTLEILCARCGRPWLLKSAFACTECICGVCADCVNQLVASPVLPQPGVAPMRRGCPRCGVLGGTWKRFQLDFR